MAGGATYRKKREPWEMLQAIRRASGVSQGHIEREAGFDGGHLSRILHGGNRLTVDQAESILSVIRSATGNREYPTLNNLIDNG